MFLVLWRHRILKKVWQATPLKTLQVQKWILARLCGTTNHNLTYCCFRTEGDTRESRNDLLESLLYTRNGRHQEECVTCRVHYGIVRLSEERNLWWVWDSKKDNFDFVYDLCPRKYCCVHWLTYISWKKVYTDWPISVYKGVHWLACISKEVVYTELTTADEKPTFLYCNRAALYPILL